MPETRTVRDAADVPPTGHSTSILVFDGDNPILDALIGCQGRVVYTEEDVEAAANRIPERVTTDCLCGRRYHHMRSFDERKDIARATITEAGGVVADEVMMHAVDTADGDNGSIRWLNSPDPDEEWSFTDLLPGDKLYIDRAKEDSE